MGLFGKIKDILFEDDGEEATTDDMPVFTNDNNSTNKEVTFESVTFDDEEDEPLKVTTGSRFKNDKRDLGFDDSDLFEEVPKEEEEVPEEKKEEELPVSKLEDSSPILPFDEDEFDRMNAHVNKETPKPYEKSVREAYQEKEVMFKNVEMRKANSNYSSTDAPRERYESVTSTSVVRGEKKFTPSPVISPVYGILDKNYKKEEIVDRVGGLKREKKVKPKEVKLEEEVVEVTEEKVKVEEPKKETVIEKEEIVKEEPIKVDLDSVRKKAYGSIDNLLEEALEEVKNGSEKNVETREMYSEPVEEVKEETPVIEEEAPLDIPEVLDEPILDKEEVAEETQEVEEEPEKMVEDLLDEEIKEEPLPEEEDVSDLILQDMEEEKKEPAKKTLDEVEKTSTLKILDDIEKELNDIEPVAKKDNLDNTLESDLFNLIDSMYEKGEE